MEILDNQFTQEPGNNTGLHVTRAMRYNWRSTAKWALFLAIVGLVIAGLSLLSLGTMIPMMTNMMEMAGNEAAAEMFRTAGAYISILAGMATIATIVVNYFHLRFANDMQRALQFNDQDKFESSWRHMRYYFRILGILTISYIVIYVIVLIVMAVFMAGK
ncbi:MAG: hypothetical protein IPK76_18205 [Lewinellaceae bacterium]|nr:hypothetical protein [Lewinellaceae bacterium]